MASEVTVTADMVVEAFKFRPDKAERIAEYAALRYQGTPRTDAASVMDIDDATAGLYERTLRALAVRLGLELPPQRNRRLDRGWRDQRESASRGGHQSNHAGRGVVRPDCPYCQETSRSALAPPTP